MRQSPAPTKAAIDARRSLPSLRRHQGAGTWPASEVLHELTIQKLHGGRVEPEKAMQTGVGLQPGAWQPRSKTIIVALRDAQAALGAACGEGAEAQATCSASE